MISVVVFAYPSYGLLTVDERVPSKSPEKQLRKTEGKHPEGASEEERLVGPERTSEDTRGGCTEELSYGEVDDIHIADILHSLFRSGTKEEIATTPKPARQASQSNGRRASKKMAQEHLKDRDEKLDQLVEVLSAHMATMQQALAMSATPNSNCTYENRVGAGGAICRGAAQKRKLCRVLSEVAWAQPCATASKICQK